MLKVVLMGAGAPAVITSDDSRHEASSVCHRGWHFRDRGPQWSCRCTNMGEMTSKRSSQFTIMSERKCTLSQLRGLTYKDIKNHVASSDDILYYSVAFLVNRNGSFSSNNKSSSYDIIVEEFWPPCAPLCTALLRSCHHCPAAWASFLTFHSTVLWY